MAGVHVHLYRPNPTRPSCSAAPPPSASTRPTNLTTVTQNPSYWDTIYSHIDSHLKKAIPIREPFSVFEPMHHLTFAPPKTTAPALCVAACELVGGHRDDAIVAASAIHLMHASIYTHNHLLLTHQPGSRPNSAPGSGPSSEPGSGPRYEQLGSGPGYEILHRFGANIKLLTGDGIVPFAFELLAGCGCEDSEKVLRVIVEISRAVGAPGMVGGGGGGDGEVGPRQLHGCGAACGAIMGGGTEEEVERLRRFGGYVGEMQGVGREMWERLRGLALKELECFDGEKIEQISTIVRG